MLLIIPRTKNEKELPLQLCYLGISCEQKVEIRTKGEEVWQWFFCESGSGEFMMHQKAGRMSAGDGVLIPRGGTYFCRNQAASWKLHIIGFDGNAAGSLLKQLHVSEEGIYRFDSFDFLRDAIGQMEEEIRKDSRDMRRTLSRLCYGLLLETAVHASLRPWEPAGAGSELAVQIYDYLDTHYSQTVTLDDLAAEFSKTREYLCSVFKKETNRTIIGQLNAIRITKARNELMRYPQKTIADIGRDCGFDNANYFCKVFKAENQITPGEFRLRVTERKQ